MAIAAYFHPKNMTLTQFNEIHQRLEKVGAEPNPHRLHHSCFGEDGDLMVYDIWDSPESFQSFGEVSSTRRQRRNRSTCPRVIRWISRRR